MLYENAIKSICDMFGKISETLKSYKEVQSETEIIKEKKDLQKAVNLAEQMIEITLQYTYTFDERDLKKFKKLYNKFLKFN